MSFAAAAARRPVGVLVGTTAACVFGALALERLPVELLPDLSYPTLTVQTDLPDAAPASVEQLVTRPIEEAVGVIPGVRDLRSVSRAGRSEVVLELAWSEPVELRALDVREKLGLVELPPEARPPRVLRFDPSLDPVVRLALAGDRPPDELRRLADRWLEPRLEAVPGVASVEVRGGLEPEVQVDVDEDRLAALGLTAGDVVAAIQAEAVDQPAGALREQGSLLLVRTLQELVDPRQVARTILRDDAAGRVRVEDVADVRLGHREPTEVARVARPLGPRAPLVGREAVELALRREGSSNTLAVSRAVRAELERLRPELPPGVDVVLLADQARYVEEAIAEVWSSALGGGLLAVLVLWAFLRDARATAIIALTIPVSVVVTFLFMDRAGVTLNVMSLGGLALGTGMLVDCAIVVLEAIDRHRGLQATRLEAAARGAGEVAGAVTASALTTVAVFVPIVFVEGVAGQMFRDLAVTVCISILASLVASLTLVPALAALEAGAAAARPPTLLAWDQPGPEPRPGTLRLGPLLLPPVGDGRHPWSRLLTALTLPLRAPLALALGALLLSGRAVRAALDLLLVPVVPVAHAVAARYPGLLAAALRRPWRVVLAAAALFAASVALLPRLGTGLVPDLTQGELAFHLRLPEGTSLSTTAEVLAGLEARLLGEPGLVRTFSVAGALPSSASGRQTLGENLGRLDLVIAGPDGAPAAPADEARLLERVRAALAAARVEGERVRPALLGLAPPVAVHVHADDLPALDAAALEVGRALAAVDGLRDVATTVEPGSPEVEVAIDRERAAALGVTAGELGQALRRQVHGQVAARLRDEGERIDVRVRAARRFRDRAERVEALRVRLPGGQAVAIGSVAAVKVGLGPAAIHRQDGSRVARVTAQAAATDLGGTLDRARAALAAVRLPPGATAELAGQDEELRASMRSLALALGLAIFLVFVVMAVQFESVVHPLVILLTVPLGLIGVVAGLLVAGLGLDALALMGVVVLAGVVVNNAIVLVDAANRRRAEGQPLEAALVDAGAERLRPILMTTATTVLGLLPMAVGLGAGGELRRPLAVTIVAGLSLATLLTLVVVPCVYRILSRERLP